MKTASRALRALACLFAAFFVSTATAGVVINEIFYHAPGDLDRLQWIELHNTEPVPIDIGGWRLRKAMDYSFPAASVVPAGGFVVLARDHRLFTDVYARSPDGVFTNALSRSGDVIEWIDATGNVRDKVRFSDKAPWPAAADGRSASLERICPAIRGDLAENWDSSPLPEDEERPAGTPGRTNASYAVDLPPRVSDVRWIPETPRPDVPTHIHATVRGIRPVKRVELLFQIVGPGRVGEEKVVPMGEQPGGGFAAQLPGFKPFELVRFRVRAADEAGASRTYPSPHSIRPALSLFVPGPAVDSKLMQAYVIATDAREFAAMEQRRLRSLKPDEGPFSEKGIRGLQDRLGPGLDLSGAWFELTAPSPLAPPVLSRLRAEFIRANLERNRLVETALSATDVDAEIEAAPRRISEFRRNLAEAVRRSVAGEVVPPVEAWISRVSAGGSGNGRGFIEKVVDVEGAWFGLWMRSELSGGPLEALRTSVTNAVTARARTAAEIMAKRPPDFGRLLDELGKVQAAMDGQFRRHLSAKQWIDYVNWKASQASPIRPRLVDPPPRPPRGQTAFALVTPDGSKSEVYDFIHVTERSAGNRIRFHKDQPWREMTSAALIFEYNDRFLLAEPLAFDVYRRAGNAACQTDYLRLTMNGHPLGYHLAVEQVNGAFLNRHQLATSGDLFKLLWYGTGIAGKHERQNHPDRTHEALENLVASLGNASGDAQWELIRRHFDVEQASTYFAVNMVLSHWDGFFNNYFTHQDSEGDGRWRLFPWDQDKTWGFHDSTGDKVFFDMPLSFGMAGDRPPGGGPATINPSSWWRPGGYFSQPLLANPEFRRRYLARIRAILEKVYTEEIYNPVIDDLARRLRPEIPVRAAVVGEDASKAMARFDRNVASLKEHLVKRRRFLLEQEELAKLPR